MSDSAEARPLPIPITKHEKYDRLMSGLSVDPLDSLLRMPRHSRNGQIGLRVDEFEMRVVNTIRDVYADKYGAAKSDQDVIRGMIREIGKEFIDGSILDSAEDIAELRMMANAVKAKEPAIRERQVHDTVTASIETITRETTEFVGMKLFAPAWRSVERLLVDAANEARINPEKAAWMLELIHNQPGFDDALEKLRANGYNASLPVLE